MDEQVGGRAMLRNLREDLPQIREVLRELPGVIRYLSEQMSHGNLQFKVQAPELKEIRDQLRKQQKQRYWLAVGATTIITGTLILTWGFLPILAWTLITAGVLATFAGRPRN